MKSEGIEIFLGKEVEVVFTDDVCKYGVLEKGIPHGIPDYGNHYHLIRGSDNPLIFQGEAIKDIHKLKS